jgi:purine-binding chemotaxis protein CheW
MIDNPLTASTAQSEQTLKVACLRVGQEFYVLDIMCIREIVRPLQIVPVPKAPAFVEGVVNLRKAIIPVVDLRRRFGLPPVAEGEPKRRIVVCAIAGRIVGLLVDEVTEVCSFQQSEVRPTPYYLSGPEAEFFPGVCRKGNDLMMLLDLRKLLSSEKKIDLNQVREQISIDRDS